MKLTKKMIILAASLVTIVSASVFGSIAYLTSEKTMTNTFTIGDVAITLNETKVDENGQPVTDPASGEEVRTADEEGNAYKMIPGKSYRKDPMVTVQPGSEASYLRMIVTLNKAAELKAALGVTELELTALVSGMDDTKWIAQAPVADEAANTIIYEYRYFETVANATAAPDALEPLFDTFTVPASFENDDLKSLMTDPAFKIEVIAQAIQASGFEADAATGKTAEQAAWEAFENQQ